METKTVSEAEALQKLSALCARSEHSSGEMRDKMRRWAMPSDAIERVVERLRAERFVDDARFARLFVRDKIRFDRWGSRKIEQSLRLKGVAPDIIESVMADVPEDDYVAVLRQLLEAKRRTVKAASDYELNAKLMRFAAGRGFTMDVIRQCIDTSSTFSC